MLSVFHIVSVKWASCKTLLFWPMVQSLTLTCIFFIKGCIRGSVVLLDYAIHWSWSFREASACSPWQSCSGFLDGSILCAARDSSHIWWVRTISWLPRQGEQDDRGGSEGMGGQELEEIIMRCAWCAPISRLACSIWTCSIGWTYTRDDYWIQMLFML